MENKKYRAENISGTGKEYDLIIIGGGTAGLFCAYEASKKGLRIALVEHNEKLGVKLSIAGGGMGNMTNRTINTDHYIGHDNKELKKLLTSLFKNFNCEDVINLLNSFDIPFEERDFGQIFCLKPVKKIIECLEQACANVDFFLDERTQRIYYDELNGKLDNELHGDLHGVNNGLDNELDINGTADNRAHTGTVDTLDITAQNNSNKEKQYHVFLKNSHIFAKNLVIATGSTAYPQIGASDFGLRLAKKWGHDVYDFSPVLVPFILGGRNEEGLLGLEGISISVRISVLQRETNYKDPCDIRSMLFTHRGLSGPAALVASCFWEEGRKIILDFLPHYSLQDAMHNPENGKKNVKNLLLPLLPDRLVYRLIPEDLQKRKVAEVSKKDRQRLIESIHAYACLPEKTDGLKKAEAARGGVSVKNLKNTLESKIHKGLYFCGEVVDVTGLLGGYNIHFALACAKRVAHSL